MVVSGYGAYVYTKSVSTDTTPKEQTQVPEDVSDRYDWTASGFDNEVDSTERTMGIGWLRSWLTRKAHGHVLEVSAGTGRNSRYYDLTRCKSISLMDQSEQMMAIARNKFLEVHPKYKAVRFLTQSAFDPILAPPSGYDTILQTMGLCSTPNPSGLLRHLGSVINRDSGRVLLLEHGRSHYEWLNRLLDRHAPAHADRHGCWWNRDIGKIVEDSGLEVVTMKRYHLGTTWWAELKAKESRISA